MAEWLCSGLQLRVHRFDSVLSLQIMKILVTGSSGFIGFHLCCNLLNKGHQITGIDNLNNFYDIKLKKERSKILKTNKNFFNYECDLNDLHQNVKGNFDIAINLAAQAGVRLPKSQNYKYTNSNITGFSSFLNFCKNKDIKNIIYASSSSVYSGNKNSAFIETEELLKPKSFYGETKINNEIQASKFAKRNNSKIIGLRFFTVYGPFGRPDMAYYNFTNQILSGKKITLFNEGNTYRDMTFIDDVCNGIESAINSFKTIQGHELFNIGNEFPINTKKLIYSIENEFGLKAKISNVINNSEVTKTYANCKKSRDVLGYNPSTTFDDGINFFFDWYKKFYKL